MYRYVARNSFVLSLIIDKRLLKKKLTEDREYPSIYRSEAYYFRTYTQEVGEPK